MAKQINEMLTDKHKKFLLTFKQGKPYCDFLNIPGIEQLPAIQWKLHNINKMPKHKHNEALDKLEKDTVNVCLNVILLKG